MQNRYVGDVGDFGKYGLLRALLKSSQLKLGVVWCLVPDEQHTNDGKHTAYLKPNKKREYRGCDEKLYDRLKDVFNKKSRNVRVIEQDGVIFPSATFYSANIKETERGQWISQAILKTASCDLIFLDPDNGIALEGTRAYHSSSPKHVFLEELNQFFDTRGRSLVVYHHLCRHGTHEEQIKKFAAEILKRLKIEPISLRFRRGTSRVFYVIPAPHHREELAAKVKGLLGGPWNQHFTKSESLGR